MAKACLVLSQAAVNELGLKVCSEEHLWQVRGIISFGVEKIQMPLESGVLGYLIDKFDQ
jgi:hypothetical protein